MLTKTHKVFSRLNSKHLTGFTLVEILISLAILAMIVASTFTIFRSASKSWQKGETRSERYHNARIAIGRMSTEISQAALSSNASSKFSGIKEDVKFTSFISTSSGVFELAEIEYWHDKDRRLLMRNEGLDPDYDFATYDYSDALSDGIKELEFSYYNGEEWSEAWESDKAKGITMPKAVKIKIKVEDKKGKEVETFEVIARLKTV